MNCGLVPSSSGGALYPHSNLSASRTGGRGWSWALPRRKGRLAGVCCCSSSSFRARAAVEEGSGLVGTFYELLGIPEGGSLDEIKRAYKQLARKYHPDVSPPELAEEYTRRFIEVQEAYETLCDPVRRAHYDCDLAHGLHLSFSRRRFNEKLEEKSRWRGRWEDQLAELKMRSMNKDSEENLSWAARMRKRRAKSSME